MAPSLQSGLVLEFVTMLWQTKGTVAPANLFRETLLLNKNMKILFVI